MRTGAVAGGLIFSGTVRQFSGSGRISRQMAGRLWRAEYLPVSTHLQVGEVFFSRLNKDLELFVTTHLALPEKS
ncbi:hypothetical protein KX16_003647 [Salmonella enterica subsp. enterica]|nr:hypothetical protein [Salmonella enterica subsp. enterica serovar Mikawasima]